MEWYAKLFMLLSIIRLFSNFLNVNRKKFTSYDLKKFTVLDDKYYEVDFLSDAVLCVGIVLISLLSPIINSTGLYLAICSFMILISIKATMSISYKKMYIKKLK